MALPEQPGTSRRRPTLAPWLLVLVLVLGLALLAGGCGSDDDEASDTTAAAATTGPGAPATVPAVEGAELAGAAEQLAEAGLRAAVKYVPSGNPAGQVIGQSEVVDQLRDPGHDARALRELAQERKTPG